MRKYITTGAAIVAALALTGCSVDDHSYHPAPDPMALVLPAVLMMVFVGMLICGALIPAILNHRERMREIDANAAARHAEVHQMAAALQLSAQTGWTFTTALTHVRAQQAQQIGAPRIH